jgi:hypothetical protein
MLWGYTWPAWLSAAVIVRSVGSDWLAIQGLAFKEFYSWICILSGPPLFVRASGFTLDTLQALSHLRNAPSSSPSLINWPPGQAMPAHSPTYLPMTEHPIVVLSVLPRPSTCLLLGSKIVVLLSECKVCRRRLIAESEKFGLCGSSRCLVPFKGSTNTPFPRKEIKIKTTPPLQNQAKQARSRALIPPPYDFFTKWPAAKPSRAER